MREIHDAPVPHESGGHHSPVAETPEPTRDTSMDRLWREVPTDEESIRAAFRKAIKGDVLMSIPVRPTDADLVLKKAIDEAIASRSTIATLTARAEEAERERDKAKMAAANLADDAHRIRREREQVWSERSILHTELERVTTERDEAQACCELVAEEVGAVHDQSMGPSHVGMYDEIVSAVRTLTSERDALRGEVERLAGIVRAVIEATGTDPDAVDLRHVVADELAEHVASLREPHVAADLRIQALATEVEQLRDREPDCCDNCDTVMDGDAASTSDVCFDCWRAQVDRARDAEADASRLRGAVKRVSHHLRRYVDDDGHETNGPQGWVNHAPIDAFDALREASAALSPAPVEAEVAKRERARANQPTCPSLMHGDDPLCACSPAPAEGGG